MTLYTQYRSVIASKGSLVTVTLIMFALGDVSAQETDVTLSPNAHGAGIQKSFEDQMGVGRGDEYTPESSLYMIMRDPFRAIARGRQLFQRKFTAFQGVGPRVSDGVGDLAVHKEIAAGFADSCAACHGRPTGSAGFGGDVFTRPDSRDAPHLFGLGLVEMLADEMTSDLRATRDQALATAEQQNQSVTRPLQSKGVSFGTIRALPDGTVDTTGVDGVDADLRVKPFFAEGSDFSIRRFAVGAFQAEMGLQAVDPDLAAAANGDSIVTPSGLAIDGSKDTVKPPPTADPEADPDGDGAVNEIPASIVDFVEFYLLNYFRPATYEQGATEQAGRDLFATIGCAECHVESLQIEIDRRVADVETKYDRQSGGFNHLFATATPLFTETEDDTGHASLKLPAGGEFTVRGIFSDLKRHDLGPAFHERGHDGVMTTEFVTEPLWGVGSTSPYGHDGRSINLREVILRHGGEAEQSKRRFDRLNAIMQGRILAFLESLVLFPPPHTASNLNPANPGASGFPQYGHGSIDLSALFNDSTDKE